MTDRTWHWRVGDRCKVAYKKADNYKRIGIVLEVTEHHGQEDWDVTLVVGFPGVRGRYSYFWNYDPDECMGWDFEIPAREVEYIEPEPDVDIVQLELFR